jgi:chromosome segregation ATPase
MIDAEELWADKEAKLRDAIDRAERRAKAAEADAALLQSEHREKKLSVDEVERAKRDAETRATHALLAKGQVETDMQIEIDRYKSDIKVLNERLSIQSNQLRDEKLQHDTLIEQFQHQIARQRDNLDQSVAERDRQHQLIIAQHIKRYDDAIAIHHDLEAEINALRAETKKLEKDVMDATNTGVAKTEAVQRFIDDATMNKEKELKELKTEIWTRDRELASLREKTETQKKVIEERRNDIIQLRV